MRNERPNVGRASGTSGNGAPSREGCVVNGQRLKHATNDPPLSEKGQPSTFNSDQRHDSEGTPSFAAARVALLYLTFKPRKVLFVGAATQKK